ncbi:MAG: polyprenyl synthetase family protein [Planctomycetes bacterium]|nr:polyprenyl synthetase family protein [Planctomycetota bacterium]
MKKEFRHLYHLIQSELIQVQQRVSEQLSTSDQQLAPIFQMISERQGKMVRPAMVLLCGKLFSDLRPEHINLAAVTELIHIASLMHDDVIDKAQLRRGQSSANALWGNTAAVLLGDFLLSRAFMLAAASKCDGAAALLGRTAQTLCIGELKQNLFKGRLDLTEQDYFQMIEAKTAALFHCSCQLGAMASGVSTEQQENLGQFGCQFGLAFQIADDLRDVLSSEKQEGKTLGTDLLQEKFTLPVIHWINQNSNQKKMRMEQIAAIKNPGELTKKMRLSGSIDYTLEQAKVRIELAKQSLDSFPATPAKEALLLFADKIVADIS